MSTKNHSYSSISHGEKPIPPKVEIFVEQLNGIMWSTSTTSKDEELEKRVPFVTAAVEFSGTFPNMKVYSATKMPFTKRPAVESYFASLAQDHHELATDTLVIPSLQPNNDPSIPHCKVMKKGVFPLVLNWHDDTINEKLIDSIAFFTSPLDNKDSVDAPVVKPEPTEAKKPHLSFSLPMHHPPQIPGLSLMHQCQNGGPTATFKEADKFLKTLRGADTFSKGKGKDYDAHSTQTNSTASSTAPSVSASHPEALRTKRSLFDLESLLHETDYYGYPSDDNEQEVAQVIASRESKERAAAKLAGDPSSRFVGGNHSGYVPSWISCGKSATPEILEMKVRVLPEDYDEYDEMDPEFQQVASPQDLEGVAHLVFLDEVVQAGTTIMDLPLRISSDAPSLTERDRTGLSLIPTIGKNDSVFLSSDATLRIRVTITPHGQMHAPIISSMMKASSLITSVIPNKKTLSDNFKQMQPVMEKVLTKNIITQKKNRKHSKKKESDTSDSDEPSASSGEFIDKLLKYGEKLSVQKAITAVSLALAPIYSSECELTDHDDPSITVMPGSSSLTESVESSTNSSLPIKEIEILPHFVGDG